MTRLDPQSWHSYAPKGVLKHISYINSGMARAFLGGQAVQPEDQIEEENEENLKKNERK